MKKDIAVFLFDLTGFMAQPWLNAGYTCYLFDCQHPADISSYKNLNLVGGFLDSPDDVWKYVDKSRVAFVCGFPPCTDLAVSGAAHFNSKMRDDPYYLGKALSLVLLVEQTGQEADCVWILENPKGVLSSIWRPPDFTFNPFEYGGYLPVNDAHPLYPDYIPPRDAYPKETCIWSGGGFTMPEKLPVYCPKGYSPQATKLGGKSLKTKNIRSATPRGFATAVFSHLTKV